MELITIDRREYTKLKACELALKTIGYDIENGTLKELIERKDNG